MMVGQSHDQPPFRHFYSFSYLAFYLSSIHFSSLLSRFVLAYYASLFFSECFFFVLSCIGYVYII